MIKEESSENLEIKSVSVKKICGYILINQTIVEKKESKELEERVEKNETEEIEERVEREERKEKKEKKEKKAKKERIEREKREEEIEKREKREEKRLEIEDHRNGNLCLKIKCIKDCFNCVILLFNCIKNSFCFYCNCSNDNSSCSNCYIDSSSEQKEMKLCLYYKEKKKSKWCYDLINNPIHIFLVKSLIIIIYGKLLTLGFEVIYDERNKKIKEKENIISPFLMLFALYLLYSIISIKSKKDYKPIDSNIDKDKLDIVSIFLYYALLIILHKILCTLIYSLNYFPEKGSTLDKTSYALLISNNYIIFMLSYVCIKLNLENEIISNSSLISVYLYIIELVFFVIKKLIPLFLLIIIQIFFSLPSIYLEYCFLRIACCNKYEGLKTIYEFFLIYKKNK